MLTVRRQKEVREIPLKRLEDIVPEFLAPEVRVFATTVGFDENRKQARQFDNVLTSVELDRKGRKDVKPAEAKRYAQIPPGTDIEVPQFKRNIRFQYGDITVLRDAFLYAWDYLVRLMRKSPRRLSVNSMYVYISDPENKRLNTEIHGGTPNAVRASVVSFLETAGVGQHVGIRIKGPLTEYRREVIYNPVGIKQRSRWTKASDGYTRAGGRARDRYLYTGDQFRSLVDKTKKTDRIGIRTLKRGGKTYYQPRVASAIHEIVKKNVQRQYRPVMVSYRFTPWAHGELPLYRTPPLKWRPSGPNRHIPELWLALKAAPSTRAALK